MYDDGKNVRGLETRLDGKQSHRELYVLLGLMLLTFFSSCQGNNENESSNAQFTTEELNESFKFSHRSNIDSDDADLTILFLGNSHTAANNVPGIVAALIHADESDDQVFAETVAWGDAFLADHVESNGSMKQVHSRDWNYIVLQAQKYSTTGRYSYPHDAAIELTKIGTEQGATVVMFPEWGRHGNSEEGKRVHNLHESIATETGAIVSPVGLAWDRAFESRKSLQLHANDGNHSNPAGAYLTACVLYSTITQRDPRGLELEGGTGLPDELRVYLQEVAWETCQAEKK